MPGLHLARLKRARKVLQEGLAAGTAVFPPCLFATAAPGDFTGLARAVFFNTTWPLLPPGFRRLLCVIRVVFFNTMWLLLLCFRRHPRLFLTFRVVFFNTTLSEAARVLKLHEWSAAQARSAWAFRCFL